MPESTQKTLLLVEDEIILAMSEKMQLEKYGYAVRTVNTGEKAIEALRNMPEIDLVLMDINLGEGIDGTQAAEIILGAHDIPIVFVSSHSEREFVERTERITSYGYVVKNSSITVLDASIKMAFELFDARQVLKTNSQSDHENAQLLASIMDNFPGVIFWKDQNSIYRGCSLAFAQSAGLKSAKEIVGKSDYEMPWNEHEANDYWKADRMVLDAGVPVMHLHETQHTCSGSSIWLDTSKIPLFDTEGGISGLLGVSLDITERKMIEEALLESEEKYRHISENTSDGIVHFTAEGTIDYTSPAYLRQLGYSEAEEMGKGYDAILPEIHPDDRDALFASIYEAIERKRQELTYTYRVKRVDGRYVWREDHSKFLYDDSGAYLGAYVSCRDITVRKMTEEALRETQERLQFALEVNGLGEWELDLKTNKVKRNQRWAEMLDYGLAEIGDSVQQGVDLQHPDDREMVDRALRDCYRGISDSFRIKYRMKTRSGSYKWIQDCGKTYERDVDGKPIRLCGTHADIDEQKRAEDLLQSTSNLLSSILESHPEVIVFALDTQYRYLAFNSRHREVMKQIWGKDIRVGTSILEMIGSHEDGRRARENSDRALAGESFVVVEDYGDEKLSRQSWLDYWSPIRASNGDVVGLTCFILNNTEQKEAERKISALLDEKELILKEVHHRIKNNMNTIGSLLSLQAGILTEPEAIRALEDAGSRIHSMSLLYDKLYRAADFNELSVREYLSSLVDDVLENFPNGKDVKGEKDLDDFMLDAKRLQTLGIIVSELLTNVMKYAFKGRRNGLVIVSAKEKDGRVVVSVRDDGSGIPESIDIEKPTGFGLQLVHALARQLNGTIRIEREEGTKIAVAFDL